MLDHQTIEAAIIAVVEQQGTELNGRDRLAIRTQLAATLAATERHKQRMRAPAYQWKKPTPRRWDLDLDLDLDLFTLSEVV